MQSPISQIDDDRNKPFKLFPECENSKLLPCNEKRVPERSLLLHPTFSLSLLVMIDMFSVSLVVPLLAQYYKNAGVSSASQRELLSSVFSSSQIVGGLLLGALADAGVLQRRTILFLSFGGSAVAYAFIVQGSLESLILSRVLVGLVKQTMTVTTTMLSTFTTKDNRAIHMGRLNASSTIAWIIGPSVGAILYKNVDERAPALLAVALFILNMVLASILLPKEKQYEGNHKKSVYSNKNNIISFISNLKACFVSPVLGSVIISILLKGWFQHATSNSIMASYLEKMYGMETHHRGYLSSYQQALNLVVQSVMVGPFIRLCGGERKAAIYSAVIVAFSTFLESQGNLHVYLLLLCPILSLSQAAMGLSLRSLLTQVTPKDSLGSVLAALDVLQNATAVTVPFYRTLLFSLLGADQSALMQGDPEPTKWVLSSAIHWSVAAATMTVILRRTTKPGIAKKKVL